MEPSQRDCLLSWGMGVKIKKLAEDCKEEMSMNDHAYAYSVLEKLSFCRVAGTEDEKKAAQLLLSEIEQAGGKGELMEFPIPASTVTQEGMRIVSPYAREVETIGYGRSGSLPEGGKTLKFYYAERGVAEDYVGMDDLSDTAVMVNSISYEAYRLLCEKHAAAFIVMRGFHYDTLETANAYRKNLGDEKIQLGRIPGFMISAKDATEMVRDGVETVHLTLVQNEFEATSRNVLAVIPGTEYPEESIALTAHYDSVPVGKGAHDNASGAAALMHIYRHFLQNPPKRTLRFIWCGAEEGGLFGSQAYIERNKALMPQIRLCFNFDMCGTTLGENHISVTGGEALKHFTEQFCREVGRSSVVRARVQSSDSAVFADHGVPAIAISRYADSADYHVHSDVLFPLGAEQLYRDAAFAVRYIERVANSVVLPLDKTIPDDLKKELEKYFDRDKIKNNG